MQLTLEMKVQYLDQEDPLEEKMATHSSYSCLENPMDRGALGVRVYRVTKESNMTKQLSTHALIVKIYNINNSFLVPENTHPYSHMQQSCFPNSGVSIQVMGQLLSLILLLQTGGPGKILL